jgi:transcriptional regulator with XRE-family HTH domain
VNLGNVPNSEPIKLKICDSQVLNSEQHKPRNIVGPVVRELRERKKMTQPMLVAKLNLIGWEISRETLAKIESQIRWVADSELLDLAEALGIDPCEIIKKAKQLRQRPKP